MELYFLRHAHAADKGAEKHASDADRPLTEEGIRRMKKAARGMRKLDLSFDEIISSPYLRARQTAEIVAGEFASKKKIRYEDTLTPGSAFRGFKKLLEDFEEERRVLFVGHQPTLGEFVSELIFGTAQGNISLKKGGLCLVETSGDSKDLWAELQWLLTCRQLESLA